MSRHSPDSFRCRNCRLDVPMHAPGTRHRNAAGLEIVDGLELDDYHYLHATRGELLRRLGRIEESRAAYGRALALVHDDAERRLLKRRVAELT